MQPSATIADTAKRTEFSFTPGKFQFVDMGSRELSDLFKQNDQRVTDLLLDESFL